MKKQGNWIYLGPTIAVAGLKKNTLYRVADLPEALEAIAKTRPAVRSLYVPTKDLAEANKRINQKGSLENTATQELLAIAQTAPH